MPGTIEGVSIRKGLGAGHNKRYSFGLSTCTCISTRKQRWWSNAPNKALTTSFSDAYILSWRTFLCRGILELKLSE